MLPPLARHRDRSPKCHMMQNISQLRQATVELKRKKEIDNNSHASQQIRCPGEKQNSLQEPKTAVGASVAELSRL